MKLSSLNRKFITTYSITVYTLVATYCSKVYSQWHCSHDPGSLTSSAFCINNIV